MLTYIILLNWNGWEDTIECLESLYCLGHEHFRIVVCDNDSSDSSVHKIEQWAKGELSANAKNPQLSHLINPPHPKPIRYVTLSRIEAEAGINADPASLTLIRNGANLGFAGGNNIGLRYALSDKSASFFWILNNDTVVERASLSALLGTMRQQPDFGLCGSINLSYYHPDEVQVLGGCTYNRWTARVQALRGGTLEEYGHYRRAIDYVNGSSMFARRAFLEQVGLMEESYFLYFEELDWAMRSRGKFLIGYSNESIIYHKEGATIGTSFDRPKRSLLSEQYVSRNRILFTKRFLPWALPSVFVSCTVSALHRLFRGDIHRGTAMLKYMILGLLAPASTSKR